MQAEYNVTDLSNGFTVLTESQSFPGAVHMGKWSWPCVGAFNLGSRRECKRRVSFLFLLNYN